MAGSSVLGDERVAGQESFHEFELVALQYCTSLHVPQACTSQTSMLSR
jgi:hypothetical protein